MFPVFIEINHQKINVCHIAQYNGMDTNTYIRYSDGRLQRIDLPLRHFEILIELATEKAILKFKQ